MADGSAAPVVLGIDLGTTEAKAALVGLDGRLVGLARAAYPLEVGPDGRAEQDPRDWWAAVARAVRALPREGVEVAAICGVSQGPTLAALDREGMPVRPAITWQDRRTEGSGGDAAGFGLLPKLAWLAREEPASVAEARWLLSGWDALGLWMSGEAATTLQAHEAPIAEATLAAAGVPASRLGPPVAMGARIGALRPAAAAMLGLRAGIAVVGGVNDGTASMLGAGLREAGDAVDTGGTSGGIGIYAQRPLDLPGVFCAPAPIPGLWVVGGAMAATGAAVDWLRVGVLEGAWSADELLREAAAVEPGAGGLVFLPYLAGERAPLFDDAARGAFVGLTLGTGRAELVRAVLEGGAFALRHVAEPIVAAGAPVRELRIAGRPAPDDAWARIKADATGFPVAIPAVGETAVLGAAILAAAGVGLVPSFAAGVAAMASVARRIAPDPAAHRRYDELYGIYRDLYPALRPAFARLAE